jgi:hypothetical protein
MVSLKWNFGMGEFGKKTCKMAENLDENDM